MRSDIQASHSHIVIIPSYNSGSRLMDTVRAASNCWQPVWVVVDGSSDDSSGGLMELTLEFAGLRVLRLDTNGGKGAAVLHGLIAAAQEGFQFALILDSDGQHPTHRIIEFMQCSTANPDAMILGVPIFGPDAPIARKQGRRIGNWWTNLETLWGGIHDSLFGFRVYPIAASVSVLTKIRGGRRYDFDTQLVVRLFWMGIRPINIPVPVRYLASKEGGVSHFHFGRDNAHLIWAHTQLVLQMPFRMLYRSLKNAPRIQ